MQGPEGLANGDCLSTIFTWLAKILQRHLNVNLTSEWKRKDWNELFLSNLFVNKKQMNSYLNRVSNEQQFLDANNFRHLADLGEQTT